MKVYEIRDVTSDESYYTKGYFYDKEKAIAAISTDSAHNIADYDEDCVILAVFEIELDAFPWDEGNKKIFEVTFSQEYHDKEDDEVWKHEVTFPKQPTQPEAGVKKGEAK